MESLEPLKKKYEHLGGVGSILSLPQFLSRALICLEAAQSQNTTNCTDVVNNRRLSSIELHGKQSLRDGRRPDSTLKDVSMTRMTDQRRL